MDKAILGSEEKQLRRPPYEKNLSNYQFEVGKSKWKIIEMLGVNPFLK